MVDKVRVIESRKPSPRAEAHGCAKSTIRGFTLIELLVALGIFSVVSLAFSASIIGGWGIFNRTEQKIGAIEAAREALDGIRSARLTTLPTSVSAPQTSWIVPSRRKGNTAWIANCATKPPLEREFCSYRVVLTFCLDPASCPPARPDMRSIQAEVFHRGAKVYQAMANFAEYDW